MMTLERLKALLDKCSACSRHVEMLAAVNTYGQTQDSLREIETAYALAKLELRVAHEAYSAGAEEYVAQQR